MAAHSIRFLPDHARKADIDEVYRRLRKYHRVERHVASDRLHKLKEGEGRPPDADLLFDLTGNVYDPVTRERLGSLTKAVSRVWEPESNMIDMKTNPRFDHVYAILRYETDAGENVPINVRVTVKKIVLDPHVADAEVRRLNDLNQGTGCVYFAQVTRIEKGVLEPVPEQDPMEPIQKGGA